MSSVWWRRTMRQLRWIHLPGMPSLLPSSRTPAKGREKWRNFEWLRFVICIANSNVSEEWPMRSECEYTKASFVYCLPVVQVLLRGYECQFYSSRNRQESKRSSCEPKDGVTRNCCASIWRSLWKHWCMKIFFDWSPHSLVFSRCCKCQHSITFPLLEPIWPLENQHRCRISFMRTTNSVRFLMLDGWWSDYRFHNSRRLQPRCISSNMPRPQYDRSCLLCLTFKSSLPVNSALFWSVTGMSCPAWTVFLCYAIQDWSILRSSCQTHSVCMDQTLCLERDNSGLDSIWIRCWLSSCSLYMPSRLTVWSWKCLESSRTIVYYWAPFVYWAAKISSSNSSGSTWCIDMDIEKQCYGSLLWSSTC